MDDAEGIVTFFSCDISLDTDGGFLLAPSGTDPSRYFIHLPFPAMVVTVKTAELADYLFAESA